MYPFRLFVGGAFYPFPLAFKEFHPFLVFSVGSLNIPRNIKVITCVGSLNLLCFFDFLEPLPFIPLWIRVFQISAIRRLGSSYAPLG